MVNDKCVSGKTDVDEADFLKCRFMNERIQNYMQDNQDTHDIVHIDNNLYKKVNKI